MSDHEQPYPLTPLPGTRPTVADVIRLLRLLVLACPEAADWPTMIVAEDYGPLDSIHLADGEVEFRG